MPFALALQRCTKFDRERDQGLCRSHDVHPMTANVILKTPEAVRLKRRGTDRRQSAAAGLSCG